MDNGSGGLGSIIFLLPFLASGVQLWFDRRAVGMKAPVADAPTVQSGE